MKSRAPGLSLHLFLIVMVGLTLFPMTAVVRMSLKPDPNFDPTLSFLPDTIDFSNFARVIDAPFFWQQLFNSVFIATVTTIVGIFLSCTAAYALSRYRFPGRRAGLMGLLMTQMFPGTLMMIPLYQIIEFLGLLDHSLGLILVYSTTAIPFCVWMMKGYFDTLPSNWKKARSWMGPPPFRSFGRLSYL